MDLGSWHIARENVPIFFTPAARLPNVFSLANCTQVQVLTLCHFKEQFTDVSLNLDTLLSCQEAKHELNYQMRRDITLYPFRFLGDTGSTSEHVNRLPTRLRWSHLEVKTSGPGLV